MTGELIPWLHEQLDADERVAREADPEPTAEDLEFGDRRSTWDDPYGEFRGRGSDPSFAHVLRHNPARVLRKVEATRRLIHDFLVADEHGQQDGGQVFGYHATGMLKAIKHAATEYDDQPGYQESWRP